MTTTKNTSPLTIEEMGESLTGFEEIGISQHFNDTLSRLLDQNPTMGLRALIFTDVHRGGETNVQQSKNAAMEMPLRDVMAYFAEAEEVGDLDPEDPDTATGKGSELPD